MIDRIVRASIRWRFFVLFAVLMFAGIGIYSAALLPIDAVPDVTTNQVQINTLAPAFAPEEMEKYVRAFQEIGGKVKLEEEEPVSEFQEPPLPIIR